MTHKSVVGGEKSKVVPARERAAAAAVGVSIAAVFAVARVLTPDLRGLGTHEQLGLGSCRMLTTFHIPCPFCGMTTSFSLMVRGDVGAAIAAQPAGAAIFYILAASLGLGLWIALSGRRPLWLNSRLLNGPVALVGLAGLCVAWMYKIFAYLS